MQLARLLHQICTTPDGDAPRHAGALLCSREALYMQHTMAEQFQRQASCGRRRRGFHQGRTIKMQLLAPRALQSAAWQMDYRQCSSAVQQLGDCKSQGCCMESAPHFTPMQLNMQVLYFALLRLHTRSIPGQNDEHHAGDSAGLLPSPGETARSCTRSVHRKWSSFSAALLGKSWGLATRKVAASDLHHT